MTKEAPFRPHPDCSPYVMDGLAKLSSRFRIPITGKLVSRPYTLSPSGEKSCWERGGFTFVLSTDRHLRYAGLSVYNLDGHTFCGHPSAPFQPIRVLGGDDIKNVLGSKGLSLSKREIVRRLAQRCIYGRTYAGYKNAWSLSAEPVASPPMRQRQVLSGLRGRRFGGLR